MSKRLILFGPMPPPYGGVSVLMSTLWAHLKSSPVRLWAVFGTPSNDSRITRFNHRRLGVLKALVKEGYRSRIIDFNHFHLEHPNAILLPIWLAAKTLLRFEWVKHVCDGSLPARYQEFTNAQKNRFRKAVGAVDEFIVVSDGLRDWLLNEVQVQQKITVIPSLLNIPNVNGTEHTGTTRKMPIDFLKRKKRVCSIGTFIPSYGFEHVALAVERLRSETKEDIGLLLLDGAFADDPEYRERVLKNRDWISVLSNVPNPEIYQLLPQCDLFVRPFEAESFGISRVEAIWCGLPVIAVDVGETRGMITYSFGDLENLTRLIREVLTGERQTDSASWASMFRGEAEENLRKFREALRI